MLSCNGVRHCKLIFAEILHKGIEAACVHLGLQDDLALCNILGIDLDSLRVGNRVGNKCPTMNLEYVDVYGED